MKITFLIPFASLSGGHRVVATYARLLQARGHEVTIVSQPFRRARLDPRSIAKRLLGRGPKRPVEIDLGFLGARHRVLDRPGPILAEDVPDGDVVVATWWETAGWVAALPASKGRKFYLLQDYETFHSFPERAIATYGMGLRMIAVSAYIRDTIVANHGDHDIEVVPNAVDHAQFDAPPRDRNRPLRVGFMHSSTSRKNVALAIDAVTRARRRIPDLEIVAFGTHRPTGDGAIPGWIAFETAPDQARIPEIYASCDAWLFTSDHEGFGLPILEAMACRTPVLATRAGAAPDLIDGRNGRLLPSDPEAFAEAIAGIDAMSDAEWRTCSDAARATARAADWAAATDRLLDCFAPPPAARQANGSR